MTLGGGHWWIISICKSRPWKRWKHDGVISVCSVRVPQEVDKTSRELPIATTESLIREWSIDLRSEGFSQIWVTNCLDSAMRGYIMKVKKKLWGGSPNNKPEACGKKGRRIKKLLGKANRFKSRKKASEDSQDPTYKSWKMHFLGKSKIATSAHMVHQRKKFRKQKSLVSMSYNCNVPRFLPSDQNLVR